MAEEKSNLEPLDEKDLDFKAKFLGATKPKNPESVVAEVKEDAVPKIMKKAEEAEKISNLEPVVKEDLDLEEKFSPSAPSKSPEKVPQEPMPAEEKIEFSKMSIMKERRPAPSSAPAEEEKSGSEELSFGMGRFVTAKDPGMEVRAEIAPQPEAAPEKKEEHLERPESGETAPRITISRPEVDKSVSDDARMAARDRDVESKVETLVRIAEMKGIPHAVKVAKHLDDNYTMDEFHDYLLTDELHEALVRRGLVEET